MPERHRFLRGMVSWIGFNRACVPFQAPRRSTGQSKYTPFKMLGFAIDALFSFSAAPMRMAGARCAGWRGRRGCSAAIPPSALSP